MISIDNNEITLQIKNETSIAVALIKLLVERVVEMGIPEAVAMGLDPNLFERLCELKVNDYAQLNRLDSKMFAVINTNGLQQLISAIDAEDKITFYITHFIRSGANSTILKKILHVDNEQVKHYQEYLGQEARRGRPSKPKAAVQDQIISAWHHINLSNKTKCEKWYELSIMFPEIRMDSLFAVVADAEK